MTLLRRCAGALALAAAAWSAIGCGSGYGAYCQDYMDCQNGNDADVEACELGYAAFEDFADLEGCGDQWSDYFDCINEEARCINNHFHDEDRCDPEASRLESCGGRL